ncbi:MAG: hypothetical protein EOM64_07015 [Erysipelotrichia bacterium]|nr:hypothetical protein [Erysipelotrichia bacterium]
MNTPSASIAYADRESIHVKGKPSAVLFSKSYLMIFITMIIGILLVCTGVLFGVILGILLVIGASAALLLFKQNVIMEVYEKELLLYDPANPSKAAAISIQDIHLWNMEPDSSLVISTNTNGLFRQRYPRSYRIYEILSQYMPDRKKPTDLDQFDKRKR